MRDVMIKLVKKGSDEHRIYEDLLHCSELSGKEFHGVLPPVAILDSQHDFSFVVMPRYARSSILCCSTAHIIQMGRLRAARNPRDSRRNLKPDALLAQGEEINSIEYP